MTSPAQTSSTTWIFDETTCTTKRFTGKLSTEDGTVHRGTSEVVEQFAFVDDWGLRNAEKCSTATDFEETTNRFAPTTWWLILTMPPNSIFYRFAGRYAHHLSPILKAFTMELVASKITLTAVANQKEVEDECSPIPQTLFWIFIYIQVTQPVQ